MGRRMELGENCAATALRWGISLHDKLPSIKTKRTVPVYIIAASTPTFHRRFDSLTFFAARLSWINIWKMSDGVWQKMPFQLSIPRRIWTAFLHFNISLLVFIVTASWCGRICEQFISHFHRVIPHQIAFITLFRLLLFRRQLCLVEVGEECVRWRRRRLKGNEREEDFLSICSPRQFHFHLSLYGIGSSYCKGSLLDTIPGNSSRF